MVFTYFFYNFFSTIGVTQLKIDPTKIKDIEVKGVVYRGKYVASNRNQMITGGWSDAEIDTIAEVREITRRAVIFDRSVIRASCIPSTK